tara:strand:+ start:3472 stop:3933 length:462 start_codon:yes stop_codon:yes gene_type:complete
MVNIQSHYLSPDLYKEVEGYCYNADYYYGERDHPNAIPTGLVHNLQLDSLIVSYFPKEQKNLSLVRAYINYFAAGEHPKFHVDHGKLTSLYYINTDDYNIDEGGCTEIITHPQYITSILPYKNTLITFDAKLVHKATSFKTRPRFTIALKYDN